MKTLKNILIAGVSLIIILLLGFQTSCTVNNDNPDSDTNRITIDSNTVLINNSTFTPQSLTVGRGTRVLWRNQDSMDHTVTSNNGFFDSGNIRSKGSFSFVFSDAGSYQYHCRIHPQMTGTIVVR
jgi:plastocyanin